MFLLSFVFKKSFYNKIKQCLLSLFSSKSYPPMYYLIKSTSVLACILICITYALLFNASKSNCYLETVNRHSSVRVLWRVFMLMVYMDANWTLLTRSIILVVLAKYYLFDEGKPMTSGTCFSFENAFFIHLKGIILLSTDAQKIKLKKVTLLIT